MANIHTKKDPLGLTRMQRQVYDLLTSPSKKPTNQEIADQLGLNPRTVKFHIQNILKKVKGCSTSYDLIARHKRCSDQKPKNPKPESISKRQMEVWTLLAEGLSNREIAEQLVPNVKTRTIKYHVRKLCRELGVADRTALIDRYWNLFETDKGVEGDGR